MWCLVIFVGMLRRVGIVLRFVFGCSGLVVKIGRVCVKVWCRCICWCNRLLCCGIFGVLV